MDCSPPGSSVHGDSLGKNTGVGCHASSRGSSPPRDGTRISCVSCFDRRVLTTSATWKPTRILKYKYFLQRESVSQQVPCSFPSIAFLLVGCSLNKSMLSATALSTSQLMYSSFHTRGEISLLSTYSPLTNGYPMPYTLSNLVVSIT